jgi:integrase
MPVKRRKRIKIPKKLKLQARSEIRMWQAKYVNYLNLIGSDSTSVRYDKALSMFFSKFKNAYRPSDILRHQVEDYKIMRKREGVSNATINIELSAGKGLYDFIIKMSELPIINPFSGADQLKVEDRPKRAMLLDSVEKIFNAATEPQELLLATLLFTTGVRGDEALKIEKGHFDLEQGLLILPPDICKGRKRGRTLPVRDDLKAMITALPDGRIFAGWADTWVTLNNKWRKLLWKAEVPVKGMHAARHTFGTTMLRTGVDIATVRDLLGHQSIKTTATYLAGVEADKVRVFLTAIPSGVENQIRPA